MSGEYPTIACAGCGATIQLDDSDFSVWWVTHGECLRPSSHREIDPRIRELLRGRKAE